MGDTSGDTTQLLQTPTPSLADRAVAHILRQMRRNDALAYQLGFGTESFELLTAAHAARYGLDLAQYRIDLRAELGRPATHSTSGVYNGAACSV